MKSYIFEKDHGTRPVSGKTIQGYIYSNKFDTIETSRNANNSCKDYEMKRSPEESIMEQNKLKIILDHYSLSDYYADFITAGICTLEDFSILTRDDLIRVGMTDSTDISKTLEIVAKVKSKIKPRESEKDSNQILEKTNNLEMSTGTGNMSERDSDRKVNTGVLIAILLGILCIVGLIIYLNADELGLNDGKYNTPYNAFNKAVEFVKYSSDYDTPYNAKFCSYSEATVNKKLESSYEVCGYYTYTYTSDSGRSSERKKTFTVWITHVGKNSWKVGTHF